MKPHLFAGLVALLATTSMVTIQAASLDLTDLAVYYNFDNGTYDGDTVLNQSDNGSANSDYNIARDSLGSTIPGKFGEALDVSSVTPRTTTADASTINTIFLPGTDDYTLTFWYRQDSAGENRVWNSGARGEWWAEDDGLQIYLHSSGNFEVAYHDPSIVSDARDTFTTSSQLGDTFVDATWNHFALVREGTSLSLWLNGNNVGSTTLSAGYDIAVTGGTDYREPNFGPDASIAGAAYDDAAIFHRALSEAEIVID